MEKVVKTAIIISGLIAVGFFVSAIFVSFDRASTSRPVTVESLWKAQQLENAVVAAAASGCIAAGMASDNVQFALSISVTRGQSCVQVVMPELKKYFDKQSQCTSFDAKCLFTAGYIRTVAFLTPSEPDLAKLQKDVDTAFEKQKNNFK